MLTCTSVLQLGSESFEFDKAGTYTQINTVDQATGFPMYVALKILDVSWDMQERITLESSDQIKWPVFSAEAC